MEAVCIYPNKISRLVTYTRNHDRRPCKRWDTPELVITSQRTDERQLLTLPADSNSNFGFAVDSRLLMEADFA